MTIRHPLAPQFRVSKNLDGSRVFVPADEPDPTAGAILVAILFAATGGLLIAGSFAVMLAAICGAL